MLEIMDIILLIIDLVAGAIGGNIVGSIKRINLGFIGNTVAGGVGGMVGAYIMRASGYLSGVGITNMTANNIVGDIIIAAIFGAILTIILGLIKNRGRGVSGV